MFTNERSELGKLVEFGDNLFVVRVALHEVPEVEEDQLLGPGQDACIGLVEEVILRAVAVVEPCPADLIARDARQPAVVDKSLVGLNETESLRIAAAGFRADPDLVEYPGKCFRVVAE